MSKQTPKTNASETLTYRQKLKAGKVSYRQGSNKAECFKAFCKGGEDAAKAEGKKRKLKEATLKAWISDWRFIEQHNAPSPLGDVAPQAKAKASAKKTAVKRKTTKTKKAA